MRSFALNNNNRPSYQKDPFTPTSNSYQSCENLPGLLYACVTHRNKAANLAVTIPLFQLKFCWHPQLYYGGCVFDITVYVYGSCVNIPACTVATWYHELWTIDDTVRSYCIIYGGFYTVDFTSLRTNVAWAYQRAYVCTSTGVYLY